MKFDLHEQTQKWLLSGVFPAQVDPELLQDHLHHCRECNQLAFQVTQLEENLALESELPAYSASFLNQKSILIQDKLKRRHMKNTFMTSLRFAGWAAIGLFVIIVSLVARSWLNTQGEPGEPAGQPVQNAETTSTSAIVSITPMTIDPALCQGVSISPAMPGEDIAFDGGRIADGNFSFEFWLSCSNSTQSYAIGTQPIERLGLYTFWIFQHPPEDVISDSYGFEPNLSGGIQNSPVSDGTTTSSGASGVLSVAADGQELPQGMFVLPNLSEPARFISLVETTRGIWSAAINFRLEAGPNGYRPVDVRVEMLPFIPTTETSVTEENSYSTTPLVEGPGACSPESIQSISAGTGKLIWPIDNAYPDQQFPGVNLYSKENNAPVMAADTGTVTFAGESSTGKNYVIVIDHGNGMQTVYYHLREFLVSCGSTVEKGQVIGETWNNVNGEAHSYIHFQVYSQDIPVNPQDVISDIP